MGDIYASRERAVSFLLANQEHDACWRDYKTLAGVADEWVTGFVGVSLSAGGELAEDARRRAWLTLARRTRRDGGWGYNSSTPPDSDSTVWCLALAQTLGQWQARPSVLSRDYLQRQRKDDGGISAYGLGDQIARFIGCPIGASLRGWTQSHACVTAAAALLPDPHLSGGLVDYLLGNRNANGVWNAYWWESDEYVVAYALAAIRKNRPIALNENLAQWRSWTESVKRDSRESPFRRAYLLLAMSIVSEVDVRTPELEQLLELQRSDGSWPSSAWLRVPNPDVEVPHEVVVWNYDALAGNALRLDDSRVFTTAAVLQCLNAIDKARR